MDRVTCDDKGVCTYSGFQQLINTTSSASGTFTANLVLDGGIYDKIYYEVTPKFGAVRTGEFSLSKKIKYIKNSSQDLRVWPHGNSLLFIESIISNKLLSGNVVLRNSTTFNEMCRVKDVYFYVREQVKTQMSIS
jgi:hypothetical protein